MKTIKKPFVFIPLLVTVLFIVIGLAVLFAGQSNEIKIYTGGEFARFLEKDAGETSKKAVLYADITLTKAVAPQTLSCELDGNGHTLTVKDTDIPYLFETVTKTGAVRNLVLAGKIGDGGTVAAGIALQNRGTVENCVITADFSCGGFASGICHTNNGTVTNSFVRSNGTDEYVWNPICAENDGSVTRCYYADGKADTVASYIKGEEMNIKDLLDTLNGYAESESHLVGWQTDENGLPTLTTDKQKKKTVYNKE